MLSPFRQWLSDLEEPIRQTGVLPNWFKNPPQPRRPRLDTLLRMQAARQRVLRKREARKLLAEHGLADIGL